MRAKFLTVATAVAAILAGSPAWAQKEIQFWHAMGGELGDAVKVITDGFNASQSEYKVVPVFKGSYTETLTAGIAAFRARQNAHPHIIQVFEVGTATMMAAKGAVYPVYQLMADAKEPFDAKSYIGPVYGYYSTTDGKLLSMPFNSSTPVFYWNKELFQKAGLDPNTPPKTWDEVGAMGKKLVAAGAKCGFTPQWQTWTLLENYGAWHDLPFATKSNGFGGLDTELKFNDPARVALIQMFADWSKDKVFVYAGREGKSTALFNAGDCAMHIASSGSAAGIAKALGKDKVGIAMMPYSPSVRQQPQNSIIGGATLWVLQGKPKDEYAGVAKFFTYLSRGEVQAKWHMDTGYVPISTAAVSVTEKSGFYKENPGRDVAVKQLMLNAPTDNSKGLRLGNFPQIRDIMDEELEAVWSGKKTAKQALDDAVSRGNKLLRDFEAANK